MQTLEIRNVSDATLDALDKQAAQAGMSREAYLRQQLEALAARATPDPAQVAAELDELDRIAAEIAAEFPDARAEDAINDLRRPV